MKRDINNIWGKICSYFSNELTGAEKESLKAELNHSVHADLFAMVEDDSNKISNTNYMFDSETDQAWNHFKADVKSDPGNKVIRFSNNPLLKIAASIVFLFGLAWLTYNVYDNFFGMQETETLAAHTEEILPDGTKVFLNANSKIEYPPKFAKDKREVKISGEVFFDVVKNIKQPFIIKSENAVIKVLGTSFNVNTNSSLNMTEVLVESGKVSLSALNSAKEIILTKGQSGIVQNEDVIKTTITDINYLSWKTQLLDFRDDSLEYVIEVLNKTYTNNIILDLKSPSDLKLYSKFDRVPLNTVVESICLTFGLKYEYIDNDVIISTKSD